MVKKEEITINEAYKKFLESGVEAYLKGETLLVVVFSSEKEKSKEGFLILKDCCNIYWDKDKYGWIAIFPYKGLYCYDVNKPLNELVDLIIDIYEIYNSSDNSLAEIFAEVVENPSQYLPEELRIREKIPEVD